MRPGAINSGKATLLIELTDLPKARVKTAKKVRSLLLDLLLFVSLLL